MQKTIFVCPYCTYLELIHWKVEMSPSLPIAVAVFVPPVLFSRCKLMRAVVLIGMDLTFQGSLLNSTPFDLFLFLNLLCHYCAKKVDTFPCCDHSGLYVTVLLHY